MNPEPENTDRFRNIVYGLAATATFSFLGWVALSVNGMSDRLTTIEVTMRENKEERMSQVSDLRSRVGRLEEERNVRMWRNADQDDRE